ncbi:hypothetical protein N9230_02780 [Akkermansiaceae bacterium]|nr:hypothetical protein [Akkermansiaceae bacterium]
MMMSPNKGPLILAALGLLLAPAHAELLAYYPFDDNFEDASGNENHLTVGAGTPTISSIAGEIAQGDGALDLDSTISDQHYLNLTTPISFAAGEPWSISFWARHRPGNDGRSGMIAGDLTNTNFLWIPRDGAVDGFRNNTGENADYISPPAGVEPAGVYHHWAIVADGAGAIEVFYDNVSLGTQNITTNLDITSIGQAYNQNIQSMNGQIDELRLYDEAIDTATIAELFGEPAEPDLTRPTLTSTDFSDDRSGGPIEANTVITFVVTFSEDMDAATVEESDFGNAGSATISIGEIREDSPGVFSIPVTPTTPGTLQLQVNAGSLLQDPAGNALDTLTPIADATIIEVQEGFDPSTVKRIRGFLLGGQSNADGRGNSSDLPTSPVNLQSPQSDVDFYESSLTTLRPLDGEFGPEITWGRCLADSLADDTSSRVAIIKSAAGGTSLQVDWKGGGDGTTTGDGPRYLTFQNTVTAGINALESAYPNAVIDFEGMLWVQGERDGKGGFEDSYEANLINFISDVRATYRADLPFIIVRLSIDQTDIPALPLEIVRDAQTAVAAADPLAALIDTDEFGVQADSLHFDASGLQEIGNAACPLSLNFLPFTSPLTLTPTAGGNLEFTVTGPFQGLRYTLYANPDLGPANWVEIDAKTASGPTLTFSIPPSEESGRQFYRIGRSAP